MGILERLGAVKLGEGGTPAAGSGGGCRFESYDFDVPHDSVERRSSASVGRGEMEWRLTRR